MCRFLKRQPCWLLAGALALLLIFALNWPSGSAEWAAWIQAVGSILAIGSGFALHIWQKRADKLFSLLQIQKALFAAKAELERSISDAPENGEVGPDLRKLARIALFLDRRIEEQTLDYEVVTLVSELSDFMRRNYDEVEKARESDAVKPLVAALYDALDFDGGLRRRIDKALTSIRVQRKDIAERSICGGQKSDGC